MRDPRPTGYDQGMAADKTRVQLDQIRALRDEPTSARTLDALKAALAKQHSHVVAAAARHCQDFALRALGSDLARAYHRLAAGDARTDPGCVGKQALIEALSALDHPDPDPFLHAYAVVQWEKGWGPPTDSAANLRGHALMAMVGLNLEGTPERIALLLADKEPRARSAAARAALAWGDGSLARALLLLRVQAGEEDPEVLADCFEALIGAGATERVLGFLKGGDPVSEAAALALGTARVAEAVGALIRWCDLLYDPGARKVGLLSIGLTRAPAALDHLLDRLARGGKRGGREALDALAVFLPDPAARARIIEAARLAGLEDELPEEARGI